MKHLIKWFKHITCPGHIWEYTKDTLERQCKICHKLQHGMHTIEWHTDNFRWGGDSE